MTVQRSLSLAEADLVDAAWKSALSPQYEGEKAPAAAFAKYGLVSSASWMAHLQQTLV